MTGLRDPVAKSIQNRIVHDEELIVRLQRGDEWAFQLLVRRFREDIFSVAFGITLDAEQSEAILQDVFSAVYRNILDYRGDASFPTWLHRITVNRCLSWKRRWSRRFHRFNKSGGASQKKHGDVTTDAPSQPEPEPFKPLVNESTRQLIDQTLKKLPEQARTMFVLRELGGLSYEEIAYVTSSKKETVRSKLFHARRQLIALLASEALEGPGL